MACTGDPCDGPRMTVATGTGLIEQLREEMASFTEAERLIANFVINDRQSVPFETASSLADKLALSPVTVGRFCRRMGYRNFRELKAELKFDIAATPWPRGEQFDRLVARDAGKSELQRDFDLNVAGMLEVYALARTPEWDAIATILAGAPELFVAGFQPERGMASQFAYMLQYARPNVRTVDLAAGHFADVLADECPGRALVIVETRRYSRQAQILARHAHKAGIALVFITDKYCHWAHQYTPHVLALPTESAMFWDTLVPMVAALTLLSNAVVLKLGASAEPRLTRISELYQEFTGHVGQAPRNSRTR